MQNKYRYTIYVSFISERASMSGEGLERGTIYVLYNCVYVLYFIVRYRYIMHVLQIYVSHVFIYKYTYIDIYI